MAGAVVLLVEDEPLIHVAVEDALIEAGFEVIAAFNSKQAIAALQDGADRLKGIITDIRLGTGPSGWDIAQSAREKCPSIPIVYMSGDSASDWSSRGVPNSIMVQKPFAMAQLVTAISQLINLVPPTAG